MLALGAVGCGDANMTISVNPAKAMRRAGVRLALMALALAMSGAPVAGFAAEEDARLAAIGPAGGSLLERLRALQKLDMQVQPERTREAIDALLAEAARSKRAPLAEIFLARKSRAATLFYSGDADAGLRELDALLAEIGKSALAGGEVEAEVEGNRAALLGLVGRRDESEAAFRKLLPYWERTRGPASEDALAVRAELAVIRYRKGDALGAEQALAEVVKTARAAADFPPHVLVMYWQNWATLLNAVGRTAEAINELQACSHYAETHLGAEHAVSLAALRNLGNALNSAGRYGEAEAVLRRTLDLTLKVEGEASPALAVNYNNLGNALNMQRGAEAALAMYQAAYDHARAHPAASAPTAVYEFLLNLAVARHDVGDSGEALRLRRQAVAEVEKATGAGHPVYARASAELGASLLDAGQPAEALPWLQRAADVYAKVLPATHNQRLDNAMLLAIARHRGGDATAWASARDIAQRASDALLEQVTTPSQTLKTARRSATLFARYAALALATRHHADAFAALQLAQLGDLDAAGAALMSRQAGDPALADLLRRLQDGNNQMAALRQERSKQVAEGKSDEIEALDVRIANQDRTLAALRGQVDRAFPAYGRLIRPEPQSLAEVQQRLGRDQALLLAAPGPDGVLSMLVARDRVAHADTPLRSGQLTGWIGRIRDSVDDGLTAADPATAPFDVGAASALHAALLPPALDRVAAGYRQLSVLGGGPLASVPMGLLVTRRLPDDARLAGDALRRQPWLLRRQAVATPTSLRLLGEGGDDHRSGVVRFAGIGAPQLAPVDSRVAMADGIARVLRSGTLDAASLRSLPDLPDAADELQRMRTAFGREALMLTGSGATEAKVRALDLTPFNVIAFATHGLVSGELRGVSEPGLVLTPVSDDAGNDGLLTASDVAELRLDADWVILSACNTAAGDSPGAPLYSGLARAFVHAGARALLLSHWQVRDDVAARLSVQTVQGNRDGLGRAEALRRAQLRLIDDRSVAGAAHPALWAPFALVGD